MFSNLLMAIERWVNVIDQELAAGDSKRGLCGEQGLDIEERSSSLRGDFNDRTFDRRSGTQRADIVVACEA